MYDMNRVNKILVTSPLSSFSTKVTCINNHLLDYDIFDMLTVKMSFSNTFDVNGDIS